MTMKEENRLILLGRYPQQFVQDTLLPDMEENIARYGVFFPAACEVFRNCRSAENSLYFHHSYAESEIPMGQEYHHIALMEQSRLLLDSVQACRSKVLCFFTAFRIQPSPSAMRGHHENSLIQFPDGIPPMIWEELPDLTPSSFSPTERQVCLF